MRWKVAEILKYKRIKYRLSGSESRVSKNATSSGAHLPGRAEDVDSLVSVKVSSPSL